MAKNYFSSGNAQADQRYAFAEQLWKRGEHESAIDLLRQTQSLVPAWAPLPFRIAEILASEGRNEEAVSAYKDYISLEPCDSLGAAIKIAILKQETPSQIPDAYIETLFDDYAPRFDHSLIKKLEYRTPDMLAEMLVPPPAGIRERILDLGCGTGLSGEALSSRNGLIDGVDISSGMLAEAEKKNLYFSLTQSGIHTFLQSVNTPYDLIVAADVFVYVGALDGIFRLASRALCESGSFAFSVQSCERHFVLGADHRYSHSHEYINHCLSKAGMKISACKEAILRKDGGNNINGLLFVATH